jgi:integrase
VRQLASARRGMRLTRRVEVPSGRSLHIIRLPQLRLVRAYGAVLTLLRRLPLRINVINCTVVAPGPDVGAALRFDELHDDTYAVAGRLHAAFQYVGNAQFAADVGIKVHAHMLRQACGYKLANDGHDTRSLQAYLGHRNIQNTTRYTAVAPDRFKTFWRD